MVKIISWNVNGLRAIMQKGFMDFIKKECPDILCIQETKLDHSKKIIIPDFENYYNCADKKGYSGTAIFTKIKPLNAYYGLELKNTDELDSEGRILTLEFEKYFLVNVYTPNSQRGLTRLKYRMDWDEKFFQFIKNLEKRKPVIFCGDLNVAHKEIDIANPKANLRNAGFTVEERSGFDKYVDNGFIDTFRVFNDKSGQYTWWSYMFNARAKNIGWRIDYFCISKSLKNNLSDSFILEKVMGSDHCPVGIILK